MKKYPNGTLVMAEDGYERTIHEVLDQNGGGFGKGWSYQIKAYRGRYNSEALPRWVPEEELAPVTIADLKTLDMLIRQDEHGKLARKLREGAEARAAKPLTQGDLVRYKPAGILCRIDGYLWSEGGTEPPRLLAYRLDCGIRAKAEWIERANSEPAW